jgi:hypothetical protein
MTEHQDAVATQLREVSNQLGELNRTLLAVAQQLAKVQAQLVAKNF